MSTGPKKKRGSSRVAPLDLPPSRLALALMSLQRPDVMLRILMCFATALAIWGISGAWAPAFTFRENYVPARDITARVKFSRVDDVKTKEVRDRAFKQSPYVYTQDPRDLELRQAELNLLLDGVAATDKVTELKPDVWKQFQLPPTGTAAAAAPPTTPPAVSTPAEVEKEADDYKQFHSQLIALGDADKRKAAIAGIFEPLKTRGLLTAVPDQHLPERNPENIIVYPAGRTKELSLVPLNVKLNSVLLGDGAWVKTLVREQLGNSSLADRVSFWLLPKLKSTLSLDEGESVLRQEQARDAEKTQYVDYPAGRLLAPAGKPITPEALSLLRLEYDAYIAQLPLPRRVERSMAVFCMIFALYMLCGYYMFFRERRLLSDLLVFCTMLASAIGVIALVHWTTADPWRAELIPLLLFSMTFGIAYHRDVALILSTSMAIIVAMTGGEGLGEFIVLMGTVATAVLQLDTIRTRGKLIRVGFMSAIVAFLLSLGMSLFDDQPLGETVLRHAGRNALWTFLTGFLMTGLLPYIEKLFGVLTDISLLELGDPSHPLMQELVRRAPGTYNHSINVASIAEAAAEQIGARGLLLRVGAYFHDIGKMLKPNYFVENQGMQASRHENLLPAMSTLIIIAHVKDGADLARQHHLPQPIIDFIEQHHGTTLVEYFYRQASKKSEENPEGGEVQESSYRYPGPKPQTVETAILMLADSVESASRSLVEPTPARIENLVEQIGMNKLLDGQFDECGLTLQQLRTVEDSLIKSLIAVYHGRVKYASTASA
jgi:putative nucleotidyltransferase with HDIG domain